MQENWVDFRAIKAAVTMDMVLARYEVNWLRKSGDELRGKCPIHKGEGQSTFHVSVPKNAFHCFSCKARGNVLDFVAAMEQCSVRDAGLKLKDWFSLDSSPERTKAQRQPADKAKPAGESAANKSLTFRLQKVDHSHPYLKERGIDEKTAERFGVGFYSGKGSMAGRIVIPIENEMGELVAYAGRSIDDTEPKYKLPAGFHKSLELYNLHRAVAESHGERRVVVVEGFFDCMKVSNTGIPCVGLMGSSLSQAQEELLARHFKNVCLMLDGDDAGRDGTDECLARLGRRMWVSALMLRDGTQPDQLSAEDIRRRLR